MVKSNLFQLKDQNISNQKFQKDENLVSLDENKNKISINNTPKEPLGTIDDVDIYNDSQYKKVFINNWYIYCFWCTRRKTNINKVLFEEGSRIITEVLDIMNMFNHLYIVELMQKKLEIKARGMEMSEYCKNGIYT